MFAWEGGTILRLLRDPGNQRGNDLQAAAIEAAAASGVRVPKVFGTATVMGRPGLIMERCDGADYLTLIGRNPLQVFPAARIMGEVHARLHEAAGSDSLPPIRDWLRSRLQSAEALPEHLARFALDRLDTLPDGDRLCHGDFHPANILRTKDGPVVIDWPIAARGHPDADVIRTHLIIRIGDPPPGASIVVRIAALFGRRILLAGYLRAYRRIRPIDMKAASRWEVPVAAARLGDGIEVERPALLRLLERAHGSSRSGS